MHTITLMEFEFDPNKDRENIKKHGVPLSLAYELLWQYALSWPDDRYEYDELRMTALIPA